MSPRPSHLQTLLRLLRHMLAGLCGVLGAREAALRAQHDALPPGHRRRAGLEKELRRITWAQAVLADPDLPADAAFRGKAAEVARVRADAGRRALARRYIHPSPRAQLRGATPAAALHAEAPRCSRASHVASAPHGAHPRGGLAACTG